MTVSDIREKVAEFAEQLKELVAQRDALNVKIISTEQNIRNLEVALDELGYSAQHELVFGSVGLTEAIKTILRRAEKPMTMSEVRTSLKVIGFDLDRFQNPSAAVSNTLQRLAKSGDLEYSPTNQTYDFFRLPPDHPLHKLKATRPPRWRKS